ncbi:unnamed protein product, partial [Mycena citricolor]
MACSTRRDIDEALRSRVVIQPCCCTQIQQHHSLAGGYKSFWATHSNSNISTRSSSAARHAWRPHHHLHFHLHPSLA